MMGEDLPGRVGAPGDAPLSSDVQDLEDRIAGAEEEIAALEAMRMSKGWQLFIAATRRKAEGVKRSLVYETYAPNIPLHQGQAQELLLISDPNKDAAATMIDSWQEYIATLRAQIDKELINPRAEDEPDARARQDWRRF